MSNRKSSAENGDRVIARNPKARHDYHIVETFEAGLVLTGSEIKSVRAGKVSLKGAFAVLRRGEFWLEGMTIAPYEAGGYANHVQDRQRKVLLNRREIRKLIGLVEQKGFAFVPLDVHIKRGYAKATLALGRGKKQYDKRHDLKERDSDREMARAMSRRR